MALDDKYMKLALDLASKALGKTSPNPTVGCVIVKNGKIVGRGYHKKAGKPHAEVIALRQAGALARGATMYVTLEPCSHFGRTPPCSRYVIQSGIKEIFIAMKDPNAKIHGIEDLSHAGIKVHVGLFSDRALALNEGFVKHITTKTPFVILKLALTLDGNIATKTGSSQYITSLASRTLVHKMRTEVDAILVGINTVLSDDPRLTPRHVKGKDPWKVVVDSSAKIPLSSALLKNPHKLILGTTSKAPKERLALLSRKGVTIILCPLKNGKTDLKFLMKKLGEKNITSVMMEAGSALTTSALNQGIVDKVVAFIAPKIIGEGMGSISDLGIRKIQNALVLKRTSVRVLDSDIVLEGYLK